MRTPTELIKEFNLDRPFKLNKPRTNNKEGAICPIFAI
jgi:hypothetical protein